METDVDELLWQIADPEKNMDEKEIHSERGRRTTQDEVFNSEKWIGWQKRNICSSDQSDGRNPEIHNKNKIFEL